MPIRNVVIPVLINDEQAALILRKAIRADSEVEYWAHGWPGDHKHAARLEQGDGDTMALVPRKHQSDIRHPHAGECVTVEFGVEGVRYAFDSFCLDWHPKLRSPVIQLAWPNEVMMLERRTAQRWRPRKQTYARLFRSEDPKAWQLRGPVLNVSTVGVAFRVPAEAMETLPSAGELTIAFRLDGAEEEFRFAARIASVTEAGTAGHCIIGVEFECKEDCTAQKQRLEDALTVTARRDLP